MRMVVSVWFSVTSLVWAVLACARYVQSKNNGDIYSLLIGDNGTVYVGEDNALVQYGNRTVTKESIVAWVNITCGDRLPSFPSIFDFVTISDVTYLLECGSGYNQTCVLRNLANISYVSKLYDVNNDKSNYFGSPIPSIVVSRPIQDYVEIFSAISFDVSYPSSFYALSKRIIQDDQFSIHYDEPMNHREFYIKPKPGFSLTFIHGFYSDNHNYVYFMNNRRSPRGGDYSAYISQMCADDSYFWSYIEAQLECNGYTNLTSAVNIKTTDGHFLLAAFDGDDRHLGSVLCMYIVSNINAFFEEQHRKCFRDAVGSTPDWIQGTEEACTEKLTVNGIKCGLSGNNSRILASVALETDRLLLARTATISSVSMTAQEPHSDIMVVFGTTSGEIEMLLFNEYFNRSRPVYKTAVTPTEIRGLTLSPGNDILYFYQETKVTTLFLDDCSVQTECRTCVTYNLARESCAWLTGTDIPGRCVSRSAVKGSEAQVFEYHCPPVTLNLSPARGPLEGGTRLTIQGQFGDNDTAICVYIGKEICPLKEFSHQRLMCITPEVSWAANMSVSVHVSHPEMQIKDRFRLAPVYGKPLEPAVIFQYVAPSLDPDQRPHVRMSGDTQLTLSGRFLDAGSVRSVHIGGHTCIIGDQDVATPDILKCRTPGQATLGEHNLTVTFDRMNLTGPPVTYIPNPVIAEIHPTVSIASGGILVTVSGQWLAGLGAGLGLVVNAESGQILTTNGKCAHKDDVLVCHTGSAAVDRLPATAIAVLMNPYAAENNLSVITIRNDPELGHVNYTLSIMKDTDIEIKGKGITGIPRENFHFRAGLSAICTVTHRTGAAVWCRVKHKDVQTSKGLILPFKGTVGNRQYELGTVRVEPLASNFDTYLVIAGCSLGSFIIVVAIICLATKCYTPNKNVTYEPYRVSYRRGTAGIMDLEGLSENQTSETAQNRQNDYQRRVGELLGADGGASKDTTPLLQVFDDVTLATLLEKGLLIDSDRLVLGEMVGQGNFGRVFRGYLRTVGDKEDMTVAAKTMHRNNPQDLDVQMFVKEALIMKDFQHKNVMTLIGICFGIECLPLVVLPFLENGDLLSYIRDVNREPTVRDLTVFSVDIVSGMEYLADLKFVHRDLAARNCMVGDDMTVRVSDFGLSRDVYEKEYYSARDKTTKLPVKWMSPESLEFGHFSSKSDVWSFGVTLWELLTRGMCPYSAVDNWDMMRFIKDGRRLEKPDFCPEEMYQIMLRCWSWEPEARPTFAELATNIPELLRRLERASEKRRRLETSRE
ncbi:hepatocyte growth factor receptor-like [Mya arenaria]|uniref:hepatocyte growth factor receptor-like n=1 Tax=Mya arenaria TaxID=6604 RepID=UPI0022E863DA|nr:hepatocyte growth factor receptor-like [Mya arenaria]XP_052781913.1 hepatocyte growth factor receptor-like [Mya arenaria]